MGNRIRELREQAGLTQRALAEFMAVHEESVRRWETGSSLPRRHLRWALARRLGVTPDQLELEPVRRDRMG